MKEAIVKTLADFGLSEKEARTYIVLTEMEAATVYELARKSGINRSSSYVVLESLRKRGLVGVSDDRKVRQYVAAHPDTLFQMAEAAVQEQTRIKNDVASAVAALKTLQKNAAQKPAVRVFQGKDGIIAALEDTLQNKEKTLRVSYSLERFIARDRSFNDYLDRYADRRARRGIHLKAIHPHDAVSKELIPQRSTDQHMFIPKERYTFPTEVAIYDDKVGYISWEGEWMAVIIESKEMAGLMKSIFDMAWEEAKRLASR
ncbi:MAG: helix-turn-helix domain-containing protein [Candidatus Andersenbacteria bacterium]